MMTVEVQDTPTELIDAIRDAVGNAPVDRLAFALVCLLKGALDRLPPIYHEAALKILNEPPRQDA
jgi:hypothetical protein